MGSYCSGMQRRSPAAGWSGSSWNFGRAILLRQRDSDNNQTHHSRGRKNHNNGENNEDFPTTQKASDERVNSHIDFDRSQRLNKKAGLLSKAHARSCATSSRSAPALNSTAFSSFSVGGRLRQER